MPHYCVNNDLYKAQGINGNLDWLIMNHLYKLVDDDKY